ncbi:peptidase M15B and M15C DD-carboxypeptidase VanY/endolysin [Allomuricauda ruestringensis DSM 13258]|uniref:Peptidase M15B and M15C DD-carboxypeptidase VanY/endolysin n=1 Tax=Allomuricauda ruestringensis (strain DSM 13258 / CIP 107369 / LMG 19739 / B1) TaxID=886377 RepID=G2PLM3_ALLRU|nr:M15 family metallopeptidase [Allomuricauda ruestringensis]AEM71110.1 peptidase M15B and M15C DD-carboxypeptidase VanY/endolysin [Allomuricauda ruestringensis DSM 13258]
MKRRAFIKTASASGLACTIPPILPNFYGPDYSTAELMGKADIELFGEGINLKEEAYKSFLEMKKAAYSDGFDIKMVSSFRDFYHQERIWERKYVNYTEDGMAPLEAIDKIIEYSTIPGTSRHHWGTDIDIIDGYPKVSGDVLVSEKFEAGGPYEGLKLWLDENSTKYGFYLVYTNNPRRRGFKYEPWHYSYAPISIPMLTAYRKLNILKLMQQERFLGKEHFTAGFIRTYVQDNILDINPVLL